jgi:hypothetical protein
MKTGTAMVTQAESMTASSVPHAHHVRFAARITA